MIITHFKAFFVPIYGFPSKLYCSSGPIYFIASIINIFFSNQFLYVYSDASSVISWNLIQIHSKKKKNPPQALLYLLFCTHNKKRYIYASVKISTMHTLHFSSVLQILKYSDYVLINNIDLGFLSNYECEKFQFCLYMNFPGILAFLIWEPELVYIANRINLLLYLNWRCLKQQACVLLLLIYLSHTHRDFIHKHLYKEDFIHKNSQGKGMYHKYQKERICRVFTASRRNRGSVLMPFFAFITGVIKNCIFMYNSLTNKIFFLLMIQRSSIPEAEIMPSDSGD